MAMGMSLLGGGGGVDPDAPPVVPQAQPDAGSLPANLPANPLGQPAAAPATSPVAPPAATPHENRVARAVRSILGTQVDYKVDPASGQTTAVPVKASGSQIFRGILAGALLGAEAGQAAHNQNPETGGFAGFTAGAGAEIRNARALDAQKYQRAQEDFKNSIESRKANQELLLQQAQIAEMHNHMLYTQMQMDLMPKEQLDKLNESNDLLAEKYGAKGYIPQITVGGKNINAVQGNVYDLQNAINKDSSILQGPSGTHRVFVPHVDRTGLDYKPGVGWVDKDGKNVDMATRTTMTAHDLPNDTMNETIRNPDGTLMTGKQLNKLAGKQIVPNDDAQHPFTYGNMISFTTIATKDTLEAAQTNRQNAVAASQAANLNKQSKLLQLQMDKMDDTNLRADIAGMKETGSLIAQQIKSYDTTINDIGSTEEEKKAARANKAAAQEELNSAMSTINAVEKAHLKKQGLEPTVAPPKDPVEVAYGAIQGIPLDKQISHINDPDNGLSPDQKAALIARVRADATKGQQTPTAAAQPHGVFPSYLMQ